MWLLLWTPTAATPIAAAFVMATSIPRLATIWPKPRFPSTSAVAGPSCTTTGSAVGSASPFFQDVTYWGTRIIP